MTTRPWDPMAPRAARRSHFRASDADREQVIEVLKAAFVQGRLTIDELVMRAGQALASRTYAELTALTADIPGGRFEAPPPKPAWVRARKPVNKKALAWSACVIILLPALGAAFLTFYGGFIILFLLAFIGATITAQP